MMFFLSLRVFFFFFVIFIIRCKRPANQQQFTTETKFKTTQRRMTQKRWDPLQSLMIQFKDHKKKIAWTGKVNCRHVFTRFLMFISPLYSFFFTFDFFLSIFLSSSIFASTNSFHNRLVTDYYLLSSFFGTKFWLFVDIFSRSKHCELSFWVGKDLQISLKNHNFTVPMHRKLLLPKYVCVVPQQYR